MSIVRMKRLTGFILSLTLVALISACGDDTASNSEFTGNEVSMTMVPGTVDGNTTTGNLVIRERNDGRAQIDITLNNVLNGAEHPVHLHFGSLDDDGEVATFLTTLTESNGVGSSSTILERLDNDETLTYSQLITFNGSIKIHFEASGPLENEVLGAANIGLNTAGNEAYLQGLKDITNCNNKAGN